MKQFFFFIFIIALNTGCSEKSKQTVITVQPTLDGKSLTCERVVREGWQVSQLYFYLSDISTTEHDGQLSPITLVESASQHKNIALLGNNCQQEGSLSNWQLISTTDLKAGQINAVVGLPFDVNHQNPMQQQSPLNVPNMFWVWQTGHKFMRFEMLNEQQHWLFHLGSTGCSSASVLRAPEQECLYPNKVNITLVVDENSNATLDLTPWFDKVIFNETNSCKSEQDNEACRLIFNNLGQVKHAHEK